MITWNVLPDVLPDVLKVNVSFSVFTYMGTKFLSKKISVNNDVARQFDYIFHSHASTVFQV